MPGPDKGRAGLASRRSISADHVVRRDGADGGMTSRGPHVVPDSVCLLSFCWSDSEHSGSLWPGMIASARLHSPPRPARELLRSSVQGRGRGPPPTSLPSPAACRGHPGGFEGRAEMGGTVVTLALAASVLMHYDPVELVVYLDGP